MEMHLDPDDVLAWPLTKLVTASKAFQRKAEREKAAYEEAERSAKRKAR